jgi:DNA excision repair protein ERCC-2
VDLRHWQRAIKDKVVEHLKNGFLVALQAPTGSGKTLFSLLVSFDVKPRVLFVVRTHNEFFPVYREAKRLGKTFSFLVGKTTACPFSDGNADPEDIKCSSCDIFAPAKVEVSDTPFNFLRRLKKEGVEKGFCPYYSLLENLGESEVVAVTYPYLFLPYLREGLGLDLREFAVVVDEAHNLDYLNDLEERKLTQNVINMAKREATSEEAKKVLEKVEANFKQVVKAEEKYILVEGFSPLEDWELEVLQGEYDRVREEAIKRRKVSKIHLGSVIKFYKSAKLNKVFSYRGSLVSKPLTPSQYLSVLNEDTAFLLMSGTLQPLEYMRKVMGITRKVLYVDAEKEVKERLTGRVNCLLATDVTSSYPLRTKEMWKRYASYVLKVFYSSRGNVLAVFPSYQVMEEVMEYVKVRKFVEGDSSTLEELEEKVKEGKTVIAVVARGKFSEGIELTENGKSLISDVVIAGVPYPPVDDYLKLRAQEVAKHGDGRVEELLVKIPASISVKQAIGRAIRSPEDEVNVWLLDKRFENVWWKMRLKCFNPAKVKL